MRGAEVSLRMFAAVAFLAAGAVWGADETAPVQKPQVKEGDRWRYRQTDYPTNLPRVRHFDERVTFVGPDEILTVNRDASRESIWNSQWGALSYGGSGVVHDKPTGDLKFPMTVGATHETSYSVVARRGGSARSKFEKTIKVIGWEDVEVPAGKFRALKIEISGTYSRLDIRASGWVREAYWYVPEVKRWVKKTYEDGWTGPTSPYWRDLQELVEFKVQE